MSCKNKEGHSVPKTCIQAQWAPWATHGGLSTGARTPEGLKRISEANLKHGRMTKDKLAEQRRLADEGRILKVRLKRIENLLIDSGLMPED